MARDCDGLFQAWVLADVEESEARIALGPLVDSMKFESGQDLKAINLDPRWDRFSVARAKASEKLRALIECWRADQSGTP